MKIKVFSAFLILFAAFVLPGCNNGTNQTGPSTSGTLVGEFHQLINANLVIQNENIRQNIKSDSQGNFAVVLPEGRYKLFFQTNQESLTLIKEDLIIENNITLKVTDAELIPIPTVTSVTVPLIYDTSVIIEWETDIESDGHIEYGTNELYGFASFADTELKKKHRIQLYELLPGTTYHFRIIASRYSLESTSSLSKDF
jgi:hypothetical protein